MILTRISCLVLLVISVQVLGSKAQEEAFRNVIVNAMKNYPAWIKAKDLDPTPPTSYVIDLTQTGVLDITGEIREQQLTAHSNITKTTIDSNLSNGSFVVHVESEFIVFARCIIDGTAHVGANENAWVETTGTFSVDNVETVLHTEVAFTGLKLVNGYIDLSEAIISYTPFTNVWGIEASLWSLSAGGYEEMVTEVLREQYKDELTKWLPVIDYFKEYFEEVFAGTPISEHSGNK